MFYIFIQLHNILLIHPHAYFQGWIECVEVLHWVTVSIADLLLDGKDHTGQPQQGQAHSHRLLVWEATSLCSEGALIHQRYYMNECMCSRWSLFNILPDFSSSVVSKWQPRQKSNVDRLRDPCQGVDLSCFLLMVCAACESISSTSGFKFCPVGTFCLSLSQ